MAGSHVFGAAPVVSGQYCNAAFCSRQFDPEVPGGRVPNRVRNDLLDTSQDRVCPHRIVDREIFCDKEVYPWCGYTGHKCSQGLSKANWIFAPQGADNAPDVG